MAAQMVAAAATRCTGSTCGNRSQSVNNRSQARGSTERQRRRSSSSNASHTRDAALVCAAPVVHCALCHGAVIQHKLQEGRGACSPGVAVGGAEDSVTRALLLGAGMHTLPQHRHHPRQRPLPGPGPQHIGTRDPLPQRTSG